MNKYFFKLPIWDGIDATLQARHNCVKDLNLILYGFRVDFNPLISYQ